MWRGHTIAVVLPTYREKASLRAVIHGFEALGVVDDIVVVNNNAEPGTSDEVAGTSAREVLEQVQGYGAAIRRGIAESTTDLVCICEPDGTFDPSDLWKLLAYSEEFDFVYGSRTMRDFIWDGANMGRFLRWGNWSVAKLLEALFNTTSLSDVGCTMRLVSGPAVRSLAPHFTVLDGAFGPEMMILSVISGRRVVQLPINYRARLGAHGTTERFAAATGIGLRMIRLIVGYRLRRDAVEAALSAEIATAEQERRERPRAGGEPTHMFPRIRFTGRRR